MSSIWENMQVDFKWVFCGSSYICEDDEKYRKFLKEMYESKTHSALLVKKEEESLLNIFKK
jgi:hypothetical protein